MCTAKDRIDSSISDLKKLREKARAYQVTIIDDVLEKLNNASSILKHKGKHEKETKNSVPKKDTDS